MSNYYKPQTPLAKGDDFIYPLTTADQVLLADGSRLNAKVVMAALDDAKDGALTINGNNIYPLTTYDQIIMSDGKKWNGKAGSDIQIEPAITSGTKLATITVDGVSKDLYYQASAVTLNGTATTSANFYAPTTAGTAGQVLKSNGNGAPVWGNGDKIVDGTNIVKPYSTTQSSRTGLMAYNTSTNQYLYLYTENASTGDLKIATNANDDSGNHYATVYTTLNKPAATDVGALPISGGTVTSDLKAQGQFQSQSTSTHQYPGLWFRNDENADIGAVYMKPSSNNNLNIRWKRDDGGGDGFYYIHCKAADGSVAAPKFVGPLEGNASTATTLSSTLAINKGGTGATTNHQAFHNLVYQGDVTNANTCMKRGLYSHGTAATNTPESASYGGIETIICNDMAEGTAIGGSTSSSWVWQWGYCTNRVNPYVRNSINAGAFSAWKKVWLEGDLITGAVWNDYAEYRSQNETIEPGYITYCDDDGKLKKTTERLQKYEGVVSDTFGFAIGETDDCKTPIAVSGRALVYCNPEETFHAGDCVCAGPDGLACYMTREEIIEFPDRIVGVVSEIPTYETWGTGNVAVNGRIWIKVK